MLMSTAVSVFRHADRVSVRGANTAGNTRRPDVLRRPKSRDEWVPRRSSSKSIVLVLVPYKNRADGDDARDSRPHGVHAVASSPRQGATF
jgi:hypothetical protein